MDNLALAKTFLIFSLILIHLLTDPILVIVAAIVIVYGDHDGHHGGRLRRGASSRLSRRIIGRKIAPFYHPYQLYQGFIPSIHRGHRRVIF